MPKNAKPQNLSPYLSSEQKLSSETSSSSAGELIETLRLVAGNRIVRTLLGYLSGRCEKDHDNRLEVALELMVGEGEQGCYKCRLAVVLIRAIIKAGSKDLGVSNDQFKEIFRNRFARRGLVTVLSGISRFGFKRPFVPGAPFQVVWNVTKACNLKCLHCYENAGVRDPDELSLQDALRGVDILSDSGVLSLAFAGGEPTVHPHILKLISRANERGMFVAMATNGIMLSDIEQVRRFKAAGLQYVDISVDGLDAATHDHFRGVKGAWEKTIQAIKNCVAVGLCTNIATTATHHNYKDILKITDFSVSLGANGHIIFNFIPTGRGREIIDSDLTPKERQQLLIGMYEKVQKDDVNITSTAPQYAMVAQEIERGRITTCTLNDGSLQNIVPTHFYNVSYKDSRLSQLIDFVGGCGAGRCYVSIEPNGDIYPCVFFPHVGELKVGNLISDDFIELWERSPVLWKFRDKDILKPYCGTCEYRYSCGGCRARAYNYTGDLMAPDPGCIYNQEFWEKLKQGHLRLPVSST